MGKTYGSPTNQNKQNTAVQPVEDNINISNENSTQPEQQPKQMSKNMQTGVVLVVLLLGCVWYLGGGGRLKTFVKGLFNDNDQKITTEVTTEMIDDRDVAEEEYTEESDVKKIEEVGFVYKNNHYSYNKENDNYVNDNDVYDIMSVFNNDVSVPYYGDTYYICSKEDFETMKEIGFTTLRGTGYEHFKYYNDVWWNDKAWTATMADGTGPIIDHASYVLEVNGNASYDSVGTQLIYTGSLYAYDIPEDAVISKSKWHIMISKDYNTNGFIYNDCHYSYDAYSEVYINDENEDDVLSSVPDEVIAKTKEMLEEKGFDYQGYHHSYDSKTDTWVCDDNSSVRYDFDSIPEDMDIVYLDKSL